MKKKIYGVLVVLCCPILLNTQRVFAEDVVTDNTDVGPVIEEIMAEALMTIPEATIEPYVEPVVEETTQTTEDSTTVDSSTDVTEETTNSEAPITEDSSTGEIDDSSTVDSSTDESVVESPVELPEESVELPTEEAVVEEEIAADTLSADEGIEAATAELPIITQTITVRANGVILETRQISQELGTRFSYFMKKYTDYVIGSLSDNRFAAVEQGEYSVINGEFFADAPDLIVDLIPRTTVGVFFNLRETGEAIVLGGYEVQSIYKETENNYSYTPPQIAHYTYTGPAVITGTFDDSGMKHVDVPYYKRNKYATTVNYVDESGNLLATETFNLTWGGFYYFTPATFSGRTLISFNGQSMSASDWPYQFEGMTYDTTWTVVYSGLTETVPGDSTIIDSVVPGDLLGSQGTGSVIEPVGQENLVPLKTIQPAENNKKVVLPETGEETNTVAVMVGTALFLQAGYMMLKKKKDESEI